MWQTKADTRPETRQMGRLGASSSKLPAFPQVFRHFEFNSYAKTTTHNPSCKYNCHDHSYSSSPNSLKFHSKGTSTHDPSPRTPPEARLLAPLRSVRNIKTPQNLDKITTSKPNPVLRSYSPGDNISDHLSEKQFQPAQYQRYSEPWSCSPTRLY